MNSFMKHIAFILCICLFIGLFSYQILMSDRPITSLSQYLSTSSILNTKKLDLTKGVVAKGSFIAKENYLGIINVRFDSKKNNDDQMIFRIKEKGSSRWYYEQSYHAVQFVKLPLFPIGFPIIKDSQGKIYDIEIYTKKGKINSVSLDSTYPGFVLRYFIPKTELLSNPKILFNYFLNKIYFNLKQEGIAVLLLSIIMFVFVTLIGLIIKMPIFNQVFSLGIIFLVSIIDIFFSSSILLSTTIVLLVYLIYYSMQFESYSERLIKIIPLYFTLFVLGVLINNFNISYKSGLWILLLFVTYILNYWIIRLSRIM